MEANAPRPSRRSASRARLYCLFVPAVWIVFALLVATQAHFRLRSRPEPVPWLNVATFQLIYWSGWALFTPAIFAVGRRLADPRGKRTRAVSVAALASVVVSLVMLAWFAFLMMAIVGEEEGAGFAVVFQRYLGRGLHYDFLTYAAILGAALAWNYGQLFRERSLRAAQLEAQLNQTQLDVLRAQLRPHFLFNTLHAIASLVEEDPPLARKMIARLSQLLRVTLELGDRREVTLREELEILDCYLEIETCRFGERLNVRQNLAPECLEAFVPPLLLQPLVENAVRHGIEGEAGPCRIDVEARRAGERLELVVRDHGRGLRAQDAAGTPQDDEHTGIGLANIRGRLEQTYPGRASLELADAPGGGARAVISLPFVDRASARAGEPA